MTAPSTSSGLWIRRFPVATRGDVLLVCFPFAGGAASWFRPLASLLAAGVEVRAVQYPGRHDRRHEPVVDDLPRLADLICDAWETPDRPFAFFGHSMGAVVAYEVTRRLALRGQPPPRVLLVSGRRAPSLYRDHRVHLKDDPGLIAELRLRGTDAAVLADDELVQMILPVVRGDYRAIETYRLPEHGAVLDVPLHALTGDADPRASVEEVAAWREHTTESGPNRSRRAAAAPTARVASSATPYSSSTANPKREPPSARIAACCPAPSRRSSASGHHFRDWPGSPRPTPRSAATPCRPGTW